MTRSDLDMKVIWRDLVELRSNPNPDTLIIGSFLYSNCVQVKNFPCLNYQDNGTIKKVNLNNCLKGLNPDKYVPKAFQGKTSKLRLPIQLEVNYILQSGTFLNKKFITVESNSENISVEESVIIVTTYIGETDNYDWL